MTISVVADSACDLPPSICRDAGIRIVPLLVSFGEESFLDREELSLQAFWERASREHPTTASPSPDALLRAYESAAAEGAEGIVSVHVSGALSRTVDTARMAATTSPVPVEVVDSRSVSLGEGLVALAAARAGRGGTADQAATLARETAARLRVMALLDTVEFLKRGGRVGRAKAALTDLLRIRPVLSLADGEPVLSARARTRSRGIAEILQRIAEPAEAAAVLHAGAPEAQDMATRLEAACGVRPIVGPIGPVTGAHLGPGALGAAVVRAS